MKKVFLVRHGQTVWNSLGITQGKKDSSLSEQGIYEVKELTKVLSRGNIDIIYTSSLGRAKQTANIISSGINIPITEQEGEGLKEFDYGLWEGKTLDEIKAKYPDQLSLWLTDPENAKIPYGENILNAQDRIYKTILNIASSNKSKNVLIVSHSTMMKLFFIKLLNMNLNSMIKLKLSNCSISTMIFVNNQLILQKFNENVHRR
ncbi:histidine phosphatase family protein [Serpentinicella sp. ANB-PHB4]|uniref:histidine phosphatase family protein n=1 Tax=Serpentinicella sp. ANB-PHB4 TaxID=3074076 RepID=UPI002854B6D7|nr:histidine phosphatase family protein [Serpentinicella sp. ANB-PHB4]MDR5658144.1 histidine phosphatase family protein [Serpentinicella sp. ANB-PHB4]